MEILLGRLIRERLKEKKQSVSWLSDQLKIDRSNVYRLFKRSGIDSDVLMRISLALDYDFFALLSRRYAESRDALRQSENNGDRND